jgi:hypothetical protein
VKIWLAFRRTAPWAILVTVAVWVAGVAFELFPAEEKVTMGDELPFMAPTLSELFVFIGAVLMTFVVASAVLVTVSLLRPRSS